MKTVIVNGFGDLAMTNKPDIGQPFYFVKMTKSGKAYLQSVFDEKYFISVPPKNIDDIDETAVRRLVLEKQIFELQSKLGKILHGECKHVIEKGRLCYSNRESRVVQTWENRNVKWMNESNAKAYCQICDKDFGWFCPVNPNGYCEYNPDDWSHARCIHCKIDSERS